MNKKDQYLRYLRHVHEEKFKAKQAETFRDPERLKKESEERKKKERIRKALIPFKRDLALFRSINVRGAGEKVERRRVRRCAAAFRLVNVDYETWEAGSKLILNNEFKKIRLDAVLMWGHLCLKRSCWATPHLLKKRDKRKEWLAK